MQEHQVHEWIGKARKFLRLDKLPPLLRKTIVCVIGGLLFIAGLVMTVAPGPALICIPAGLLLLASEFKWAEDAAQKLLNWFNRAHHNRHQKHANE